MPWRADMPNVLSAYNVCNKAWGFILPDVDVVPVGWHYNTGTVGRTTVRSGDIFEIQISRPIITALELLTSRKTAQFYMHEVLVHEYGHVAYYLLYRGTGHTPLFYSLLEDAGIRGSRLVSSDIDTKGRSCVVGSTVLMAEVLDLAKEISRYKHQYYARTGVAGVPAASAIGILS